MVSTQGTSTVPVSRATSREGWVDVAKGIAILLVVMFHSVIFLHDIGLAGRWRSVAIGLDTFRMPLFFFTAGMFAPKALLLSFPRLFRRRMASLLWLYLLWSLVWAVAFQFITWTRGATGSEAWLEFSRILLWPNASTWFVYALAVFFAYAWAVRRLPVLAQFALPVVLAVVFGTNLVNSGNESTDKAALNLVFFMAAIHLGTLVRAVAPRVTLWSTAAAVAGYGAVAALVHLAELGAVPGTHLITSVLAVAAGLAVAVLLARSAVGPLLEYLGRNTLPIYVLHFYPIFVVVGVFGPDNDFFARVALLLPVLLTVLSTATSLGFYRLTRRVPFLYGLPATWTQPALTGQR